MTNETDGRHFSEACERNKAPILEVLKRVLPEEGLVLEIGSGTGRHAAHFAPRLPGITWQPSDRDPDSFASIDAWARQEAGSGESATGNQQEAPGEAARPGVPPENKRTPNLLPPIVLDVTGDYWEITEAAAVFSANMIHIAPWDCCLGLLAGAGRVLNSDGVLVLYGPFKREGEHTAPSNESFDHSLRARDPAWGVRDLDAVADAAAGAGLDLAETVGMPANNLIAVFRRRG